MVKSDIACFCLATFFQEICRCHYTSFAGLLSNQHLRVHDLFYSVFLKILWILYAFDLVLFIVCIHSLYLILLFTYQYEIYSVVNGLNYPGRFSNIWRVSTYVSVLYASFASQQSNSLSNMIQYFKMFWELLYGHNIPYFGKQFICI